MIHKKVITKRFVSPDGRIISEATSVSVVASGPHDGSSTETEHTETITQIVTANVSSGSSSSSSRSSSCSG